MGEKCVLCGKEKGDFTLFKGKPLGIECIQKINSTVLIKPGDRP